MKQYIPLRDKVIIKVYKEEFSSGGILIVANDDMQREEGEILALGKSMFYDTNPEELKVGDRVAFARYAGKLLDIRDGYEIRTMRDIDLLCVIKDITQETLLKEVA